MYQMPPLILESGSSELWKSSQQSSLLITPDKEEEKGDKKMMIDFNINEALAQLNSPSAVMS